MNVATASRPRKRQHSHSETLKVSKIVRRSRWERTCQIPRMPAQAGIQLSPLRRKCLKKLDSRLRGNERLGGLRAFPRVADASACGSQAEVADLFTASEDEGGSWAPRRQQVVGQTLEITTSSS